MTHHLDFFISEEYRGKEVKLPKRERDLHEEDIYLQIPVDAHYLDINPLEDEEEFQGDQTASDRQELNYYGKSANYLTTQNLEHQIITEKLMIRLRFLFKKQY